MKDKIFDYFRVIGQINAQISKANSIDEALHVSLKLIHDIFEMDASILWYETDNREVLRPFFWYGSYDFTSVANEKNDGSVGTCITSQAAVRQLDYKVGSDNFVDTYFNDKKVISNLVVPITCRTELIGCIQLIKFEGGEAIEEDLADVCEILADMVGLALLENEKIVGEYKFNKVILSTRGIHKSFKSGEEMSHILKGVNLDVYEGEFLAILGESGCGKSTYLNIIGGMDQADEGSFLFMGKEMVNATIGELTDYRRYNIGFVFQSYNLMPNLTAKQNLQLIAELVDNPMNVDEALEMVGLSEKKNRYPGQLSGGQQQRISIARALVKKPKIIFADEPTAALDYETSIEVLSVFEKVVKAGTTLVMVTHNEEITRMADRVLRFRNGQTYEITINKNPVSANELVW
ncbi:MAG: ATP-binding cassette domain-containing protein [Lachnospiraceae bacterium]|nr:ATP-binding cassette domain-containing protein [Candidatus Colinaster equi]